MVSEWRPIETAPLDGTPALIVGNSGNVWWARWYHVGPRAGWRWESFGLGAVPFAPTHWFPVPPPPTPAAGGGMMTETKDG